MVPQLGSLLSDFFISSDKTDNILLPNSLQVLYRDKKDGTSYAIKAAIIVLIESLYYMNLPNFFFSYSLFLEAQSARLSFYKHYYLTKENSNSLFTCYIKFFVTRLYSESCFLSCCNWTSTKMLHRNSHGW